MFASHIPTTNFAWDVYARQLVKLGYGYPLWKPSPGEDGEIKIGDVGLLMEGGGFLRIFNTITREDDNHRNLPEDAELFDVSRSYTRTDRQELSAGYHFRENITKIEVPGTASVSVCSPIFINSRY